MQSFKTNDLSLKRFALAACFLGLVLGLTVWVFSDKIKNSIEAKFPAQMAESSLNSGPLFYTSIGHAPSNFRRPNLSKNRKSKLRNFTLEISTSKTKMGANKALKKLSKKGIQAYYTPLSNQGHVIYRIRTGIFKTHDKAIAMSRKLRISKNIKTRPIRLN